MSYSIPDTIHIGSRIQIENERATVKFIGVVGNSKGEWLGIEWDNPLRGKHDGTHEQVNYFSCRYPTSGSFIRYHPKKISTGIYFLTALKDKYLEDFEGEYDESKDRGELYWGGNKSIKVETYGFKKIQQSQRQLSNLKVVGLAEQLIAFAGATNEIKNTELAIEDLDLSRNLISNWETVSEIVSQLPRLEILRINQLRLTSPQPIQKFNLDNLKTLALNQTLISWKDVEILATSLLQLEDLQLGGNEISELSSVNFPQLKCLNLENNLIHDWKEVLKLGTLPKLQTLFLNDNQLQIIEKPIGLFKELSFLRIERNRIDNWDSIDALNYFQNLTKLRCKENPIFKELDKEIETAQVVGRIKNLSNVNGNTVKYVCISKKKEEGLIGIKLTHRERIDLERYYIKLCTKDGSSHEAIALIHPRYNELCANHGQPDLEIQSKGPSIALKDRLINLTLTQRKVVDLTSIKFQKHLPAVSKSMTKKFLPTMTVRNTKHIIQRLLKIPATKQALYLLQPILNNKDHDLMVMEITDDLRDLKFYGINDGDEILVLENE
ncbi:uncharacterized protein BX663DRAFT_488540 [Cokeromyces recurvatus]|uniref:uncharacterized protein n=1 Tax=Cokeromyces recurvatus TaxID=90255 RepID=UPI00221FD9B9|nr:uncharacterized protein BX663DRAFT_488540 [Cokeromyces recurvatus]KAI7900340.1 hypothetical protein BX663DRAFT_488540 [Cokeromyces recurvatus]